ncbi:hypothetical protein AA12717_1367 [Gluconacetobacter sacchari DSM 12717]|uniref:Uncharacterized protein n=2 Tax=Gluconacetobacter sacchari TaxID=92759 RepID=A0A7W4NQ76_9PROT|nr:hypothetical protein [Gluconacetobacter sacchari]MBB2159688.1 hypothetical protein [Gluconacetobacter sacchari]GBQ23028.1 hypothetical protein AA12717_1367 [Gluconacetobacter sacchari DSM 12717]
MTHHGTREEIRSDIMGSLAQIVRDGRERSALADGWFAGISRLATAELRAENERLREALELLVADCKQYPAWERPCFALDVAEAGLRGEDHSPERTLPDNVAATLSAIPQAPDGRTDRDISGGLKADMFWEAADPEGSADSAEVVIERCDPFVPVQMETAFMGPNIWGFHDGTRNFVFATEAECVAAIDAAMDREGRGNG